jgi:hypothetical protein
MNTTRYQKYQEFRKNRAARKAARKAELRATVKAAKKAGEIKRPKPLKTFVSDFAFGFEE